MDAPFVFTLCQRTIEVLSIISYHKHSFCLSLSLFVMCSCECPAPIHQPGQAGHNPERPDN